MSGKETILEVLIGFLKGNNAGPPPPLSSRDGVLESYGVAVARMEGEGDERRVVMLDVGPEKLTPIRRRHRIQLNVLA